MYDSAETYVFVVLAVIVGFVIAVGVMLHLDESKEFEERVARHACVVQHVGSKDICTEPDGKVYLRHP